MPLPRASLTIRRGCRKIRDTRKSISTAVGSDGVSRKSHCIGAPARGRRRMTDVLSSAPRERRPSRGHRAIYAILLSVRISCGCGLGAKRCFMRRFAAFRQCDRTARAKLCPPTNSLVDSQMNDGAQEASGRRRIKNRGDCSEKSIVQKLPFFRDCKIKRSNILFCIKSRRAVSLRYNRFYVKTL